MNQSLEEWITITCNEYLQLDSNTNYEEKSSSNLIENIISLGKYLLPQHQIHELLDIKFHLIEIFHLHSTSSSSDHHDDENVYLIIKLILKYVVSPHCHERENFVSHILSLSPDIQEHLMEAIQSQATDDEEEVHDGEPNDETEVSHSSTSRGQTSLVDENPHCDICPKLKQELTKCHKEINNFVHRERQLQEQYKSENSFQMNKIMDLESLVTEKTLMINEMSLEMNLLKKKEVDYDKEVKEKHALVQKLTEVQDQVDSLIQMSKRADIAEKQVEKLREKLDRLDGVNEQLKAETAAHNETHVTLLQYEQELNTLRTAKHHLEDYRKRCVENEILINDLKIQLKKSEDKNEDLVSKLQDLMDGNEASCHQTKLLTAELLEASEEIRNRERGLGVGLGISEFNPEVKKELQALRAENEELKQLLHDSSLESLDILRQQISDQQCFNSSLQEKWNDSKETIKQLQKNLTETLYQLDFMRNSYRLLGQEYQELSSLAQEDRNSMIQQFHLKENFLKKSFNDELELLVFGRKLIQNSLESEVEQLYNNLELTTNDYNDMREKYFNSQTVVENQEITIKQWTDQYSSLDQSRKDEINQLIHEHEQNIKRCDESYHEKFISITQQHTLELSLEKQRFESLENDMEIERGKRRKIEREKKFYENEAIKYRNQYELLSSGNMNSSESNSKEMTSVLKEMKIMQDQLDNSREEVKRLQDQLSFIQATGGRISGVVSSTNTGSMTSSTPNPTITTANSDDIHENESDSIVSQGIHSGPTRTAQRVRLQSNNNSLGTLSNTNGLGRSNTTDLTAYIEQTELLERKIEQMNRERRELIAKNIEENKEKVELNQRLLQHEREFNLLKSKFVKLELEKERLERRIAKGESSLGGENAPPLKRSSSRNNTPLETI